MTETGEQTHSQSDGEMRHLFNSKCIYKTTTNAAVAAKIYLVHALVSNIWSGKSKQYPVIQEYEKKMLIFVKSVYKGKFSEFILEISHVEDKISSQYIL